MQKNEEEKRIGLQSDKEGVKEGRKENKYICETWEERRETRGKKLYMKIRTKIKNRMGIK